MTTSNQKYRVRKYTVVKDEQLYKYNGGKVEEIGEMIQVSEFKDKLRFYTGDKDPWTVFPDSYDCHGENGHLISKSISKEPNRKQPPQFGDVGCFSACRCPDSNMFVVIDYDELNDMIYAIFPYLTVKDAIHSGKECLWKTNGKIKHTIVKKTKCDSTRDIINDESTASTSDTSYSNYAKISELDNYDLDECQDDDTNEDKTVQINFGTFPAIKCGIFYDTFIPCSNTDEFKIYKFPYQRDSHGHFHSYLSINALSTFYDYESSWS